MQHDEKDIESNNNHNRPGQQDTGSDVSGSAADQRSEKRSTNIEQEELDGNESSDFKGRRAGEEPEHQFNATPEGNSFTLREESPGHDDNKGN